MFIVQNKVHNAVDVIPENRDIGIYTAFSNWRCSVVDVYSEHVPEKIAGCEIIKSVGIGIMGQNFLAKDGKFSHVIKAVDHRIVKRMSEAGKLTGEVSHPNVLPVKKTEVDEVYDEVYFMDYLSDMEAVEHTFYRAELIGDILDMFLQVAEGINFAHKAGVSHNNFKPGNLLIKKRKKGLFPMVIDFGFSLTYDEQVLTSQKLASSVPYMAPEVIKAFKNREEKDPAFYKKGDIYSFGATFCEALTGHALFWKGGDLDVALREKEDLNVKMVALNTPSASVDIVSLGTLVRGCLSFGPENRISSFEEVIDLLKQVSSAEE